jgi:hypothetical protein
MTTRINVIYQLAASRRSDDGGSRCPAIASANDRHLSCELAGELSMPVMQPDAEMNRHTLVSLLRNQQLFIRTMTSAYIRILIKSTKALGMVSLVAVSCAVGSAQVRPPVGADRNSNDEPNGFASIAEEMRAKREIQSAEKAHKENLARARNLALLSAVVWSEFKEKNSLDRESIKNLEKAEKLAKTIRDNAGGSDDEVELENRPADLSAALSMLSEVAESLNKKVEKTPKRVVSTALIDEANVLLELIRIARAMHSKT